MITPTARDSLERATSRDPEAFFLLQTQVGNAMEQGVRRGRTAALHARAGGPDGTQGLARLHRWTRVKPRGGRQKPPPSRSPGLRRPWRRLVGSEAGDASLRPAGAMRWTRRHRWVPDGNARRRPTIWEGEQVEFARMAYKAGTGKQPAEMTKRERAGES